MAMMGRRAADAAGEEEAEEEEVEVDAALVGSPYSQA